MTAKTETSAEDIQKMISGFKKFNLLAGWNVLAEEVPRQPAHGEISGSSFDSRQMRHVAASVMLHCDRKSPDAHQK